MILNSAGCVIRLSLALVLASANSLFAEETAPFHDFLSHLQSSQVLETRKQPVQEVRNFTHTAAYPLANSCSSWAPLDLMASWDTLRLLGYVHSESRCKPPMPLFLSLSTKLGTNQPVGAAIVPILFVSLFFLLLMRIMIRIWVGSPPPIDFDKEHRPEAESWKKGILAWLYVDFATEWVKRWGDPETSDKTKIAIRELGKLGDPEDECETCCERMEELWKLEVQEAGLEGASLLKVIIRFLTWKRILGLSLWTSLYDALMFLGPPMAMSLLIKSMDDIYLTRLSGGEVEAGTLIPVTLIAIILFAGLPVAMGVANTFTAMLSMRISIRLVGGLACAAYHKSQRLPFSIAVEDTPKPADVGKEEDRNAKLARLKKEGVAVENGVKEQTDSDKSDKEKDNSPRVSEKSVNLGRQIEEVEQCRLEEKPEQDLKQNLATVKQVAQKKAKGKGDVEDVGFEAPKKFNLVQVMNADIGFNLTSLPLKLSKLIISIPAALVLLFLLVARVGTTVFLALFVILCISAILMKFVFQVGVASNQYMKAMGKKLRYLEELFFNIQVVKGCGWESMVEERVEEIRDEEISHLESYFYSLFGCWTLILAYPDVLIVICLWGPILLGGNSKADDIWAILPLLLTFETALQNVIGTLPDVVNALPSLYRLEAFFKQVEAPAGAPRSEHVPEWMGVWPETDVRILGSLPSNTRQVRVQGDFAWSAKSPPTIRDIDLAIPFGSSFAIVGKVGSGKTSLLMAMLGELYPIDDARITVPNVMAYSAQTPFIMEGTLQDNVMIPGAEVSEELYNDCINAACLFPDLQILPGGDKVQIGSRGISLSGGQRARVSLARAAYCKAPLLIVDDPFAALDSRTGLHILDNYVFGDLLKSRTRVVVCQPDADRIQRFDQVAIMSEGRIVAQGSPADIVKTAEFKALLNSSQLEALGNQAAKKTQDVSVKKSAAQEGKKNAVALREQEFEGRASREHIVYFLSTGGYWNMFVVLFGYFGVFGFSLLSKTVLQHWSSEQMEYRAGQVESAPDGISRLAPYLIWALLSIGCFAYYFHCGVNMAVRMSRFANKEIVHRLLGAPVDYFFDKTPVGRIMNRFSVDMKNMDRNTFDVMQRTVQMCWQQTVMMAYMHLLMPLYFTICSIPLYILLVAIVRRYTNTAVPMRYLAQICSSKTAECLTEVESSLPFIRGSQSGDGRFCEFMERMANKIMADNAVGVFLKRWATQRLFLVISFFMSVMVLICIWIPSGMLSFGALGLCMTNMLQICISVEFSLDQWISLQFQFIHMNRLHEYAHLRQEKPRLLDTDKKYQSFTVWLRCESMGFLQYDEDASGSIVIRRTKSGGGDEVILVQKAGTDEFVAPPGKTFACLEPTNANLQKAVDWHRLVEVGGISGDAHRMAEKLCDSDPHEEIRLNIQSGWLAAGAMVELKNLTVGYGDNPRNVLVNVSLTIDPCSKVAFVGATGCGKSSLLLCMLRLIELREGSISINGVNTASLGLQTLRTTVGLVPQDPVLLQSSVRNNLDTFGFYDDNYLWDGLRMVGLDKKIEQLPEGMDTMLSGEGASLSFGQRQLLCLARMCVRRPALMLLDEATSALDPNTQEVVQKTIETRFTKSTLLVVAHRLETILAFDKVVVLDKGSVAEQGPIKELKDLKGGLFAKMIAAKQTW